MSKKKYIDAYALMDLANNHIGKTIDANDIARFPVADVEEVRHGYWSHIRNIVLDKIGTCSVCGERRDVDSYCSNCGAKMDSNMEEENIVLCKDCKYLMFSDCYGECKKGYRGIVDPDDTCEYGVRAD